jgi:hypothetical protein
LVTRIGKADLPIAEFVGEREKPWYIELLVREPVGMNGAQAFAEFGA